MDELMKNVLYISYDGMTDPLGQSQVLPYLVNLSASGYNFTILSCEKKKKYKKNKEIGLGAPFFSYQASDYIQIF